jgi:hypothetical protein
MKSQTIFSKIQSFVRKVDGSLMWRPMNLSSTKEKEFLSRTTILMFVLWSDFVRLLLFGLVLERVFSAIKKFLIFIQKSGDMRKSHV